MSQWAYVYGTVVVEPMGRTQPEKRYILETVLQHLPRVTGSEGDMDIYVLQKNGYNSSCSCDEFGQNTDNLTGFYGGKSRFGHMEMQREYILAVDGSLRDRSFTVTKREFVKWLCRLAKRVWVRSILVRIISDDGSMLIEEDDGPFGAMEEPPSWARDNDGSEPTWCEYLMWDRARGCDLPMALVYKYYSDPENDAEFERRMEYDHWSKRG